MLQVIKIPITETWSNQSKTLSFLIQNHWFLIGEFKGFDKDKYLVLSQDANTTLQQAQQFFDSLQAIEKKEIPLIEKIPRKSRK